MRRKVHVTALGPWCVVRDNMLSVWQLLHDCPKGLLFQAKSWNKLRILEKQNLLQMSQVLFRFRCD